MSYWSGICIFMMGGILVSCDGGKPENRGTPPPPSPKRQKIVFTPAVEKKAESPLAPYCSSEEWDGSKGDVIKQFAGQDLGIILYYASDCPHSQKMGALLAVLPNDKDYKVSVVRVNVDFFPELANNAKLEATPKISFVQSGKIVGEFVGSIPNEKLTKILSNLLKK